MRTTAALLGALTALSAGPAAAEPWWSLPPVGDPVHEIIACSEAGLLRTLGVLIVSPTELRDDRPIVQLRDASDRVLWTTWTPPGARRPTTSGVPLSEAGPAPFLDALDATLAGCWFWARDPAGAAHVRPEGEGIRVSARMGALGVQAGFGLDATALAGGGDIADQPAPRTAWRPDALQRFATPRLPMAEPSANEGSMSPNNMVRMVLSSCDDWQPGVTLAVGGTTMALFCPGADPKASLEALAAKAEAAGSALERDGDVLVQSGALVLLPRIAPVAGGVVMTNSVEVSKEVTSPSTDATPWWGPDVPTTGVWTSQPRGSVHVVSDGDLYRADMLVPSVRELAGVDLGTPVDRLEADEIKTLDQLRSAPR